MFLRVQRKKGRLVTVREGLEAHHETRLQINFEGPAVLRVQGGAGEGVQAVRVRQAGGADAQDKTTLSKH